MPRSCRWAGCCGPDEIAAAVCWVLLEDTNLVGQVVSPNGGAAL